MRFENFDMKKIVGIGNALVDVIVQITDERLFQEFSLKKGGMEMIDKHTKRKIHNHIQHLDLKIASGGSTANTIHGLARLGAETGYIGKISEDQMGNFFKTDLLHSNITPHLIFSSNDTGIATTFMTPDAERTFATYLGAAAELLPEDIDDDIFTNYQYIHVEGYLIFNHKVIEHICQQAKKQGLTISMDMASFNVMEENRDFMRYLLENFVDIILGNEEEAKALTGKEEKEALDVLSQYCDISVVKLGKRGSLVKIDNTTYDIPAVGGDCIDANGLGDIYAAGFLYGLMNHYTPQQSGYIASYLANELGNTMGAKLSDTQWENVKKELFI